MLKFDGMTGREKRKGIYKNYDAPEQLNYDNCLKAWFKLGHVKEHVKGGPVFGNQLPRDISMYTQTDALYNIMMENQRFDSSEVTSNTCRRASNFSMPL